MLFCHLERSGKKIYYVIKKRSFKIESSHWGVPQKKQFLLKNITNRKESLKQIIKRLPSLWKVWCSCLQKKTKTKTKTTTATMTKRRGLSTDRNKISDRKSCPLRSSVSFTCSLCNTLQWPSLVPVRCVFRTSLVYFSGMVKK